MYYIQHCFICRPSDSTDAGIEPRTVRCNWCIGTWHWQSDALTTRLDLIRSEFYFYHRCHLDRCRSRSRKAVTTVSKTREVNLPPVSTLQLAASISDNGSENFRKRYDAHGITVLEDREKMNHEKT